MKTVRFGSDAAGLAQLQRYLDKHSTAATDFLVLLQPTGGYYALALILDLLGKGYRVVQVENRAAKDYPEKVFGSETKADETDARLMPPMGFLHGLVDEDFSIRPVHLTNPDAAALNVMVGDLSTLQKEITRRRNQLEQITAATFPELKTFFCDSTASPTARALLPSFPTPHEASDRLRLGDHRRRAGRHPRRHPHHPQRGQRRGGQDTPSARTGGRGPPLSGRGRPGFSSSRLRSSPDQAATLSDSNWRPYSPEVL